jgi:hypothetical protein
LSTLEKGLDLFQGLESLGLECHDHHPQTMPGTTS